MVARPAADAEDRAPVRVVALRVQGLEPRGLRRPPRLLRRGEGRPAAELPALLAAVIEEVRVEPLDVAPLFAEVVEEVWVVFVSDIPGIEEVNVFKKDGSVVHFKQNVKLQAATGANTYVVTGKHEEKSIQDLMPGILPHLGPELAQQLAGGMGAAPPAAAPSDEFGLPSDSDDSGDDGSDSGDDVPELVEQFDETQK